jgi:hypothetical protein
MQCDSCVPRLFQRLDRLQQHAQERKEEALCALLRGCAGVTRLRETGPTGEVDPVAHAAARLMREAAALAGVPPQDPDASKLNDAVTQQSMEGEAEGGWLEKHESWRRKISRRTGRAYYINRYTGQARWAPADESAGGSVAAAASLNPTAKSAADTVDPSAIRTTKAAPGMLQTIKPYSATLSNNSTVSASGPGTTGSKQFANSAVTAPHLETAAVGGSETLEVGARVLDDLPRNWVQVRSFSCFEHFNPPHDSWFKSLEHLNCR